MKNSTVGIALTFVLSMGLLYHFYDRAFKYPNGVLMADSPDAIKSFACYAGHVVNDSTYTHFENMNYPYGQIHAYTDGQTALANSVKLLNAIHPVFGKYAVAIYNLLVLLSFALCAVFIFLILRHFSLPVWLSMIGGICIMILSPQIHRLGGHPTLAYTVVFPMTWWFYIQFNSGNHKWLFSLLIGITNAVSFFIHPYFILLNALFLLCSWAFKFIENGKKELVNSIIHFSIQIIIPLLLTRIYAFVVDHHLPRSEYPWGFWWFYATFDSVFLPTHLPFKSVFEYWFGTLDQPWEAWSYIGIPAGITCLFLLWRIVAAMAKRRTIKTLLPFSPAILKVSLVSAVVVLLYSMCIPFKWHLEFLVTDVFGFLRQFRSLGRFAWVFYYIITVYTFYNLWLGFRLLRQKKLFRTAYTLAFIVPALFLIEAWPYHTSAAARSTHSINWFDYNQLPDEYKQAVDFINANKSNYQCMVPMPFYHIGTENFGPSNEEMLQDGMVIAHHTNFPSMGNSTARTPILEGKRIMQFFGPAYFQKDIEQDLPNKKPFLLITNKHALNDMESYYMSVAEKLFENDKFVLAKLDYSQIFNVSAQPLVDEFLSLKDSLKPLNSFLVTANADTIIYQEYEGAQDSISYRFGGAFEGNRLDFNTILEKAHYNLTPGREYTASYWHYNKGELRTQIGLVREICEQDDSNCQWLEIADPRHSTIIDGDWSYVELKFKAPTPDKLMKFIMKSFEKENMKIYIDEFMIRPSDADVYQLTEIEGKQYVIKNNILIPVPLP